MDFCGYRESDDNCRKEYRHSIRIVGKDSIAGENKWIWLLWCKLYGILFTAFDVCLLRRLNFAGDRRMCTSSAASKSAGG